MDEDDNDAEEDPGEGDHKLPHDIAPEYKRLIAIPAGKPKGGLEECLKVDPDKARRLSLSEQQLENAAETHGKEIVRYQQALKHSVERTLIWRSTCASICCLKPCCHECYLFVYVHLMDRCSWLRMYLLVEFKDLNDLKK